MIDLSNFLWEARGKLKLYGHLAINARAGEVKGNVALWLRCGDCNFSFNSYDENSASLLERLEDAAYFYSEAKGRKCNRAA